MPQLEARALRRVYGRLVGLSRLDLRIDAGECVALIGANGSGKSTAVRAITGLLDPSSGIVRIAGFDPHVEPEAERARAQLAILPDAPVLYDDLTVRQHLEKGHTAGKIVVTISCRPHRPAGTWQ